MNSSTLLDELREITQTNIQEVKQLLALDSEQLNYKPSSESWSILECMEHLNRYGNFYIPEITQRIKQSKHEKSDTFKTGLLGDYFAKSMLPKEKLNKMKTFKSMNPNNSQLDASVLDTFLDQQKQLLKLLDQSENINLTKTKTAISISKLIKLRLGDTLRVVIYHNWRHVVQAKKVVDLVSVGSVEVE